MYVMSLVHARTDLSYSDPTIPAVLAEVRPSAVPILTRPPQATRRSASLPRKKSKKKEEKPPITMDVDDVLHEMWLLYREYDTQIMYNNVQRQHLREQLQSYPPASLTLHELDVRAQQERMILDEWEHHLHPSHGPISTNAHHRVIRQRDNEKNKRVISKLLTEMCKQVEKDERKRIRDEMAQAQRNAKQERINARQKGNI